MSDQAEKSNPEQSDQASQPTPEQSQQNPASKIGIALLIVIPLSIIVLVNVFGRKTPQGGPGTQAKANPGTPGQTSTTQAKPAVSPAIAELVQQMTLAANKGNLKAMLQILQLMNRNAKSDLDKTYVKGAYYFVQGIFSYYKRNYQNSAEMLVRARNAKVLWSDKTLAMSSVQLCNAYWAAQKEQEALKFAKITSKLAPNDPIALFNTGVIEWHLSRQPGAKSDGKWKETLRAFEKKAAGNTNISLDIVFIAQSILSGGYNKRPPVIRPQEPSAEVGKMIDQLAQASKKAAAPKP
jgi:tetratricopeptide (TPR) repeat protein